LQPSNNRIALSLIFDRFATIATLTAIYAKYATFANIGFCSFGKIVATVTFNKETGG
jgi:hypothetical protein